MPVYAPFGTGVFNQFVFGVPPTTTFLANMSATPSGYSGALVKWTVPAGTYNEMVLVRSSSGYPATTFDGVTLLDQTSAFTDHFLDSGLKPGLFYYYTLFVYATATSSWVSAGQCYVLVLSPVGSGELLSEYLPSFYLDLDDNAVTQAQPQGPLRRYLNLLGWELDWIRSEINSLLNLNNIDLVRGDLLPLLGQTFGIDYEPILGMSQTRRLLKNLAHAYKMKGTSSGLATIASSYTGFGAIITKGKNLEIQLDNSATDLSVGIWNNHRTNCTLASSTAVSPQHTSYQPVYGSTNQTTLITATAGGAVAFSSSSTADIATTGIPVVPGQQISLSGYFRAATSVRSWFAQIDWYSVQGVLLSSTVGTATADTTTGMTRASVVGTAPANAAYIGRTFGASGLGAGEGQYFDASQIEVGATPTTWDPPRDIKINLFPKRQNYAINPSFEADVANWSFTNVTTPASAVPPVSPKAGTKAARMTATANGNILATSATFTLAPSTPFFLSLYTLPGSTVRNFFASLIWQLSVGGPTTVNGTIVAETVGAWTRAFVFGVSPANATGVQIRAQVTAAVAGEVHWLDAVLLEPSNFLNSYFDGNSTPTSDYLWESTPNESVSDYYPRLSLVTTRLAQVLPDFIPLGSTFSIVTGAAAFSNSGVVE